MEVETSDRELGNVANIGSLYDPQSTKFTSHYIYIYLFSVRPVSGQLGDGAWKEKGYSYDMS